MRRMRSILVGSIILGQVAVVGASPANTQDVTIGVIPR